MATVLVVTINSNEAEAVESWMEVTRVERNFNLRIVHWNLGWQGNIGAGSRLSALLSDRLGSGSTFDLIIGYGCAGLPKGCPQQPILGDVAMITEAAYHEVGQTFPLSSPAVGPPSPCMPEEVALLRTDKAPPTHDVGRIPAGAPALPVPIQRRTLSGRESATGFTFYENAIAFTSDKVVTVDPAPSRGLRVANGKKFYTYAEALYEVIKESSKRPVPVVVAVEMEAFGIFTATRRLGGQTFLLRVLTDHCSGKNEALPSGKTGKEAQLEYLIDATSALDHLIKELYSRSARMVASHFARRFASSVREFLQLGRIRYGADLMLTLARSRILGFSIAWDLYNGGLARPDQVFPLMWDKMNFVDARDARETDRDLRRLVQVAQEIDEGAFDEMVQSNLPEYWEQGGNPYNPGRIVATFTFAQLSTWFAAVNARCAGAREELADAFRGINVDDALTHALIEGRAAASDASDDPMEPGDRAQRVEAELTEARRYLQFLQQQFGDGREEL